MSKLNIFVTKIIKVLYKIIDYDDIYPKTNIRRYFINYNANIVSTIDFSTCRLVVTLFILLKTILNLTLLVL